MLSFIHEKKQKKNKQKLQNQNQKTFILRVYIYYEQQKDL